MTNGNRLIIFFIPPEKIVNGGIMSIFSICKNSREFSNIHKSKVVISTYPGHSSYAKNDLFENDEKIYAFDDLVIDGSPEFLQIHVPEYASHEVFAALKNYSNYLSNIADLRVNILTQNILLLQPPTDVACWFSLTSKVTQTTAHDKYASQSLANEYNLPTHHLSTFIDPSQYKQIPFKDKEDIIVLSPDQHKDRLKIVDKLKIELPNFKLVTVKDMIYEDYKKLMGRAKFTLTFGEGLDGYFIESFFSGGIAFAVYNEDFFPDESFATLHNMYSSYDEMIGKVCDDIKHFDEDKIYSEANHNNVSKLSTIYSFDTYTENLKNFYLGKFTYVPENGSAERLIGKIIKANEISQSKRQELLEFKESEKRKQAKAIEERDESIRQQAETIELLDERITRITNSALWKATRPARKASRMIKRKD